jgi:hypothetical protein
MRLQPKSDVQLRHHHRVAQICDSLRDFTQGPALQPDYTHKGTPRNASELVDLVQLGLNPRNRFSVPQLKPKYGMVSGESRWQEPTTLVPIYQEHIGSIANTQHSMNWNGNCSKNRREIAPLRNFTDKLEGNNEEIQEE